MKLSMIIACAFSAVALVPFASAQSQSLGQVLEAIGRGAAEADMPGTIEVSATGKAEREPDRFVVRSSFRVRLEDRRETTKRLEAFIEAVDSGVPRLIGLENLRIETLNLSTSAEHTKKCQPGGSLWGNKDGACSPIGYNASVTYRIEASPADKAGDVMALLEEFNDSENAVEGYFFEDFESAIQEARADAIRAAMMNARVLADGAGVKVGRIHSIQEGPRNYRSRSQLSGLTSDRDSHRYSMAQREIMPEMNLSVHPKKQDFQVTVRLQVEIIQ